MNAMPELPADIALPHGLRQLIDVAGLDAAIAIVLEYGGTFLDVPRQASGTRLEAIVGVEAAAKLIRAFGGDRLAVPLAKRPLVAILLARGVAVMEIARLLRVTRKTVQLIKTGKTPALTDQLKLL